jgi:hypothetical protein
MNVVVSKQGEKVMMAYALGVVAVVATQSLPLLLVNNPGMIIPQNLPRDPWIQVLRVFLS